MLNFQWVPGHAGSPGNKHADSFLKTGSFLLSAMVPGSSAQLSPKLVTPSITNGDGTFPYSSSHLNCLVPTVSPELSVSHAPYALIFSHSLPR